MAAFLSGTDAFDFPVQFWYGAYMSETSPTDAEYAQFEAIANGGVPYLELANGLVLAKNCPSCISHNDAIAKLQKIVGRGARIDLTSGVCAAHLKDLWK